MGPAVVRKRGHDLHRVCARATPCARAPAADGSALRQPQGERDRARYRVRGSVLFQPRVSPTLWHDTLGIACRGKARLTPGPIDLWNPGSRISMPQTLTPPA